MRLLQSMAVLRYAELVRASNTPETAVEQDELPTIRAQIKDPRNGITYEIFAYRDITREEAVQAIRLNNSRSVEKAERGSVIRILTTLR